MNLKIQKYVPIAEQNLIIIRDKNGILESD